MPPRRQLLQASGARAAAALLRPATLSSAAAQGTPQQLPPLEVIALNRLAFGPRPGDLDAFRQLGSNDRDRLATYLDQQLNPSLIDDGACAARLNNAEFATLGKSLPQLWADH